MKKMKSYGIFVSAALLLSLVIISIASLSFIKAQDEFIWDYEGKVETQSEKLETFAVTDPTHTSYYIFLFDKEPSLPGPETIIVLYGLHRVPLIKDYYETFYESTEIGGIYRFKLNTTLGLRWLNITASNANASSSDYDPVLANYYNEVKFKISTTEHYELFENPNNPIGSELRYPIHLAPLTNRTGTVMTWEVERKDGNIIGGKIHTFGPTNPIFSYNKTGYVWPTYNLSIVTAEFRGAVPHRHSITASYSSISSIGAIFLTTWLSIYLFKTRRQKK